MLTRTKLALTAMLLAGSVATASAGFETFDEDLYHSNPWTVGQQGGGTNAYAQQLPRHIYAQKLPRRIERRLPETGMPGFSPAEKAMFDRASQPF
jgi:hypothetical protein